MFDGGNPNVSILLGVRQVEETEAGPPSSTRFAENSTDELEPSLIDYRGTGTTILTSPIYITAGMMHNSVLKTDSAL